MIVAPLVNET